MSKNIKIKEFAKELYTQYDKDGRKLHSLRSIAAEIAQKMHKSVSFRTVKNWADQGQWDRLNERIKQESILKAQDSDSTIEEQIIESESGKLAIDLKNAERLTAIGMNVCIKAWKAIESKSKKESVDFDPDLIAIRDAISMIRIGTDIKFRIKNIPESEIKAKKQFFKYGNKMIEY